MNTPAKQPYKIKARHIGPIMELDSELSNKDQNLIFARNGMGKSFLSRAFRYIAEHSDYENSENIAKGLVSVESPNGTAKLQFLQKTQKINETDELATLELNSQSDIVDVRVDSPTIFHVFSEDFVDKELRQKKYELDGNIVHPITLGKENIELEAAHEELTGITKAYDEEYQNLQINFNEEKLKLKNEANIRGGLGAYEALSVEKCFIESQQSESSSTDKPSTDKPLSEIINDLNKLKSIRDDLTLPENLEPLSLNEVPYDKIQEILEKPISPASIAKDIKDKIDDNYDFYETGKELIDKNPEICPLCDQSLENKKTKEIIDAYIKYFDDAEAQAKKQLGYYFKLVNDKIKSVESHEQNTNKQEKLFNDIKQYIPSQKENGFENTDNDYEQIIDILTELKNVIQLKKNHLSQECKIFDNNLEEICNNLNSKLERSDKKSAMLKNIYDNINKEKKLLRIDACTAFIKWFLKEYKTIFEIIHSLKLKLEAQNNKINQLKQTSKKDDARSRVAKTLRLLLYFFFKDKYSFDEKDFKIKMNNNDMSLRGIDRTLSDGEKSVVAFCYFIAMIHLKVKDDNDYKKLFLVFDDPVTSMSYDFVYSIVQVLKYLRILNNGDILIANRRKDEQESRIKLLILTHNSYFFNIAFANDVVKDNAAFSLDLLKGKHVLSKLDEYISPFRNQLKDIILVAEGKEESNHTTANSIRSVLEAIKRFCHPDKELNEFFGDMVKDIGIDIQSVLIHDYSHGHPREMDAPPIDFKKACEDAIKIANEFIPGQINKITGAKKAKKLITNH